MWHKNNHLYKKFPKTWNESFCHVGTINERDIYHKMKALIVLWTYCFLFNSGPFDIHFISRFTVGQGNHSIGITSSICHGQVTAFYYPEITNCEKKGFGLMVFNATFNNISVILWRSIYWWRKRVLRENHRPVASHWQTLPQIFV